MDGGGTSVSSCIVAGADDEAGPHVILTFEPFFSLGQFAGTAVQYKVTFSSTEQYDTFRIRFGKDIANGVIVVAISFGHLGSWCTPSMIASSHRAFCPVSFHDRNAFV